MACRRAAGLARRGIASSYISYGSRARRGSALDSPSVSGAILQQQFGKSSAQGSFCVPDLHGNTYTTDSSSYRPTLTSAAFPKQYVVLRFSRGYASDWEGIGDRPVMDNDAGDFSTGDIWSFLIAPADGVVVLVDGLHNLTGMSWWLTIIGSTLAFRMALFPFTITYIKKSAQFAASMSLLPQIRPSKDSGRSFAEQYRAFTKRRLELGVPSPLWGAAGLLQVLIYIHVSLPASIVVGGFVIAPSSGSHSVIQKIMIKTLLGLASGRYMAPLFLYWIIALRGMAMNNHPGFDSGGLLWFVDLTVPVHGALGAVFPSLVALTYFTNIQVSFRVIKPRNDLTGFFMKIYQWWLEAVTIPLFIMSFYLPQGVFMYWLTNNCFNLAQNDGYRARFGLPLLSELDKLRAKHAFRAADDLADLDILDVDTLLSSATKYLTEDRDEEALRIMKFLQSKYPEESEVDNLHGMFYIKKQRWQEATEYYSCAISKAKDDTPRITALMGGGISLYNQGRRGEAIDFMKPLMNIGIPKDSVTRQKFLRALVTLASVLSQEGLKDEALSVLKLGVKWDSSINAYIKELQKDMSRS